MRLSEELVWRGFRAENTFGSPAELDGLREDGQPHKFYWGADPSSDSLTIGNLAAMMMVACFMRYGYKPYLLVGGATGMIGDPKESGERDLKALSEVEHNKECLLRQYKSVFSRAARAVDFAAVDNYDWFKDMKFLPFLREIFKEFSVTQMLDRKFVQDRIGAGGAGISLAEFCYTTIQGYDFLHLYRKYGVDLQVCGADQFGNCTSGMHLIRRLEGAEANVWSTPLVIDRVSGKKFGKSEGNAIWLDKAKTSVFDFYQFWLGQPDEQVEEFLKIYTLLGPEEVEAVLREHAADPSRRVAQKRLAEEVTKIVHGEAETKNVVKITTVLFEGAEVADLSAEEIELLANTIPIAEVGHSTSDVLVNSGEVGSKSEARRMIESGAVSVNGEKITDSAFIVSGLAIVKKGKNRFILVK